MLRKLFLCAIPVIALGLGALAYTSASASSVPVSKVHLVKNPAVSPKTLPPFRVNLVNRVNRIDYINRVNIVNKVTLIDRITRLDRIDRVSIVDRISRATCPDFVPKVDTGVILK